MKSVRRGFVTLALSAAFAAAGLGAAAAEPIAAPPAQFAPELMEEFEDEYGVRELDVLRAELNRALEQALTRVDSSLAQNGAGLTLDVTIERAQPNRPTFAQLGAEPGLSYVGSFGVGGAALTGVLRRADGQVLAEIDHRYFETDIRDVIGYSTWHDARRAFRGFADKVAQAYQQAHAAG